MPPTNHLRSDSPLYLTLLEHPFAIAWKPACSAATTSTPWLRAQLPIGSNWSLIARSIVNLAPPNQRAPSASRSFPQLWLHPDRQFADSAEQRHTHLTANLALYLREVATFLLYARSATCVFVDVQMRSTLRPRSLPIGVPGMDTEAATTTTGILILCLGHFDGWLAVVCGFDLRRCPGDPVLAVLAQTHLCALSGAAIQRHGERTHSRSVRHRSNRTVTKLDKHKSSEVQQRARNL